MTPQPSCMLECSKGRRPCRCSSATSQHIAPRWPFFTPEMISACLHIYTASHARTHARIFSLIQTRVNTSLVVARLHNITGKNTRISCIGLQWGIWWIAVKMSNITSFCFQNDMLTLQNLWFYTGTAERFKRLVSMGQFWPQRCWEGVSAITQKILIQSYQFGG